MERQEVLSLIRLELRKFAKPGEETSGFTADRIIMSDAGGVLQPHSSISGTELSRLEGFLDSAVVTHSTVATTADTSTSLVTAGGVMQAINNLVDAAPGHLDTPSVVSTRVHSGQPLKLFRPWYFAIERRHPRRHGRWHER